MHKVRTVEDYLAGFAKTLGEINAYDSQGQEITLEDGIHIVLEILRGSHLAGGKIMFIGNGGSAAIASHFAVDYWHAGGMKAMDFNNASQLTCLTNDHGYEHVFSMPIRKFANNGDTLVAISSSGNSENILNGVIAAREADCKVATLSGFENVNELMALGDVNFYVPVSHYGYVELAHKVILHCILDLLSGDLPFF